MNIVKHTYPWEHYTIDNVLSKDELKKIQAFAQLKESKFSNEKENVVKASGEGRYFVQPGGAMGAAKNVVLEPLASALGGAAVLHK